MWLALAVALIPGSAGFLGIGHYYLRRLRRGFVLFLIGWVLYFLFGNLPIGLGSYLALYLWQAYDVYHISRRPSSIAPPAVEEKTPALPPGTAEKKSE